MWCFFSLWRGVQRLLFGIFSDALDMRFRLLRVRDRPGPRQCNHCPLCPPNVGLIARGWALLKGKR